MYVPLDAQAVRAHSLGAADSYHMWCNSCHLTVATFCWACQAEEEEAAESLPACTTDYSFWTKPCVGRAYERSQRQARACRRRRTRVRPARRTVAQDGDAAKVESCRSNAQSDADVTCHPALDPLPIVTLIVASRCVYSDATVTGHDTRPPDAYTLMRTHTDVCGCIADPYDSIRDAYGCFPWGVSLCTPQTPRRNAEASACLAHACASIYVPTDAPSMQRSAIRMHADACGVCYAQALCRFHSGVVTYRVGRHRRRLPTTLRQFRLACVVVPGLPRLLALRCLLGPYQDAASSPTQPTSRATWELCYFFSTEDLLNINGAKPGKV